jgi:hypothetical protein
LSKKQELGIKLQIHEAIGKGIKVAGRLVTVFDIYKK